MNLPGDESSGAASHSAPTIIVPGPELAHKIDLFASKLSTFEKRRADELMAKTLASPNRNKFLYVDPSHIFYPYFLQKLTEFRQNPSLRIEKSSNSKDAKKQKKNEEEEEGSTTQPPGSSSSGAGTGTTTTTTKDGKVQMAGGTLQAEDRAAHQQLLEKMEAEGRRYQTDPYPSHYSLDLEDGTLEVPPLMMEFLTVTAQYVAKYGDAFLHELQAKQQRTNSGNLQFLQEQHPRHGVFTGLVASYRRILNASDAETEERLVDQYGSLSFVKSIVEDKMKYVKASLARRQAALLTDEALRARLQWSYFQVLHTFTLSDVRLDGPVPPTAMSQQQQQRQNAAGRRGGGTVATTATYLQAEEVDGDDNDDDDAERDDPTAPGVSSTGDAKRFRTETEDLTAAPPRSSSSSGAGAPPTFQPTFMSSNLVHSDSSSSGNGGNMGRR